VHTIPESLEVPVSTIYFHLVEAFSLKFFLHRWVPYTLTGELRQKRIEFSSQLLRVLEIQQRVGFGDIVTRAELCGL
jgi:hypothetical protein